MGGSGEGERGRGGEGVPPPGLSSAGAAPAASPREEGAGASSCAEDIPRAGGYAAGHSLTFYACSNSSRATLTRPQLPGPGPRSGGTKRRTATGKHSTYTTRHKSTARTANNKQSINRSNKQKTNEQSN